VCGIAGLFVRGSGGDPVDAAQLDQLRRALLHRGPDASDVWISDDRRCGLAHTRLAIVDLSPTGAQPMSTPDGRYVVTFNGEIYNHEDLRRELESRGHVFRGRSDTEVLLRLYVEQGAKCLDRLDGQFAFAVYDRDRHTLFCARDPLGEKPLYLVRRRGLVAFASEVRALLSAGVATASPDLRGIGLFLRQGSIPPPYTHLEDVEFLPPGSYLEADDRTEVVKRYYEVPFVPEDRAVVDRRAALEGVRAVLEKSVARRLRADVPVATFLSGGLDSSLVAALMVKTGAADLRTFTVTLPGRSNDEAGAAKAVAAHLGTVHQEIPLELDDRHGWLDEAIDAMDVPSIDGPNTWLVSRAVRQAGLKVACSGLGGDELFFGYPSFRFVARAESLLKPLHSLERLRGATRKMMAMVPGPPRVSRAIDALFAGGGVAALWFAKRGLYSEHELRQLLEEALYSRAAEVDPIERIEKLGRLKGLGTKRQVSFYELSVYMHDQLLRDTDAMSMAHALEVRVPLIGREVVEVVAKLGTPVLDGPLPKQLLRDIAAPLLPSELLSLPKRGFTLDWLDILGKRVMPLDPTASGLLRAGALAKERQRLVRSGRGFARAFALDVLASKMRVPKKAEGATGRAAPAQASLRMSG
jgi:asparagine synthase (glutamine-hydrolysing)